MTRKSLTNKLIALLVFLVLAFFSIWFLLARGIIHMDWYSDRQQEVDYEKNKNADRKILILGDSQLESWPVDHCLQRDIQHFCEENGIGCVNTANAGFGPIEHLDRFKAIAPDYKPDLTIVFVYAGNDITDVMYREDLVPKAPEHEIVSSSDTGEEKKKQAKQDMPEEIRKMMLSESAFDWAKLEAAGISPKLIEYAKNRVVNPTAIGEEYVNPHLLVIGSWKQNYLYDNCAMNDPAAKFAWIKIARIYEELLLEADKLGSEVCFVTIPSTVQIDDSHFDLYKGATFNVGTDLHYSNAPQEMVNRFCFANRLQHVDLLPEFIRQKNTADLYFKNDDHLSSEGHRIVFHLVKTEILDRFVGGEKYVGQRKTQVGYYKSFKDWALDYYKHCILTDDNWQQSVRTKAQENGIEFSEMLELDSQYLYERDSLVSH